MALVVKKHELWNTAKLSIFKSAFVPILTNDNKSWAMTGRVLSQVQVAEMGFLQRVHAGISRTSGLSRILFE